MDSSQGIIFVCLGIPKVDQETIAKVLGNIAIVSLDDFSTSRLIGTDDFPVLFGVELGGKFGRVHQITKHHRELPSFCVRRMWCRRERCSLRGWLFLSSRRLCWLHRGRGCGRKICSVPNPNEHSAIFISSELLCLNNLCFEGFEILVIQAKPYLEGWIRHTSLPFQEGDDLFEDVVECHVSASINASSCTIEQEQNIPRNHSNSGNASRESRSRIERACPGTRSMHPFCSNVTTIWCTAGAETLKYRCISVSAGG